MKTLKTIGAVCLTILGITAVTITFEKAQRAEAQSIQVLRDFQALRFNVYPQGDDTTNAMTVWDKTGTNGFQVSPVLATPAVVISNNVYSALVYTNFIVTNSAGTAHTITIRNGLVTSYQ